jgi:hypothetical protein
VPSDYFVLGRSYIKIAPKSPWESQFMYELKKLTLPTLLRSVGFNHNGEFKSIYGIAEHFVPAQLLNGQSGIYPGNEAACAETGRSEDCNAVVRFSLAPIQYGDISVPAGLTVSGQIKLELGEQLIAGSCVMSLDIEKFFLMSAMKLTKIQIPYLIDICGDSDCVDGPSAYMQLGSNDNAAVSPAAFGAKFCKADDFFCLELNAFVRLGPIIRVALMAGPVPIGSPESIAVLIQANLDGMAFETSIELYAQQWTLGVSWNWMVSGFAVSGKLEPKSIFAVAEAGVREAGAIVTEALELIKGVLDNIRAFGDQIWNFIFKPGDTLCQYVPDGVRDMCTTIVNAIASVITAPLGAIHYVVDQVLDYVSAEVGDLLSAMPGGTAQLQMSSAEKHFLRRREMPEASPSEPAIFSVTKESTGTASHSRDTNATVGLMHDQLLASFTATAQNASGDLEHLETETVAAEEQIASTEKAAQEEEKKQGAMGKTELVSSSIVLEAGLIHSVWNAIPHADHELPAPSNSYALDDAFKSKVSAGHVS